MAPKGNQFWRVRSSHGRKPVFATPDALWSAATEYFQWVTDHPLYEAKAFAYQGEVVLKNVPKMRAMTIGALCIFLDIDRTTWLDYKAREGFTIICTRIEDVIRTQKFEGAAAELLNPNIIARELGLADKTQLTGKDDGPLSLETLIVKSFDQS